MAPTSAVLKYAALADPRRPDPRRARFSRRLVVLHLALVRAHRRSGLYAASGARRRRADRLERHMAAARHRNLRQARAEWGPPQLYRVRARLPGRRALYRRCRRPARLCEGRCPFCARPARRTLPASTQEDGTPLEGQAPMPAFTAAPGDTVSAALERSVLAWPTPLF